MDFAVAVLNTGFPAFLERVRLAEELGFEMVCFGDSQSLFREAYVSNTAMVMSTKRSRVAMTVSNPVTRHPAVVASACASLDELSGGRFVLGLGTGDSALYNIGEKGVKVAVLESYINALRDLWTAKPVEYQGKTIRMNWPWRRVPIMISAEGPATLRLAGRLCESVCVGMGLTDDMVSDSLELLSEGAHEAGRSLDDIDVWFFAKGNIAETREEAIDEIKMALAASANHGFRFTFEGKRVPTHLQSRIQELQRRYRPDRHEQLGANPNRDLLDDDPELLEFLAERFGLAGTPDDLVLKLKRLERAGVNKVFFTAIADDPANLMRRFASEVRPKLEAKAPA
ncbi:MAG TPA: LLM class flavin-dependent oxidoreductase [Candidatus Dormibacteraeota bacterium]